MRSWWTPVSLKVLGIPKLGGGVLTHLQWRPGHCCYPHPHNLKSVATKETEMRQIYDGSRYEKSRNRRVFCCKFVRNPHHKQNPLRMQGVWCLLVSQLSIINSSTIWGIIYCWIRPNHFDTAVLYDDLLVSPFTCRQFAIKNLSSNFARHRY